MRRHGAAVRLRFPPRDCRHGGEQSDQRRHEVERSARKDRHSGRLGGARERPAVVTGTVLAGPHARRQVKEVDQAFQKDPVGTVIGRRSGIFARGRATRCNSASDCAPSASVRCSIALVEGIVLEKTRDRNGRAVTSAVTTSARGFCARTA